MTLWSRLQRLSRLQRITLILFVTVILNAILDSTTGYQILGGDLLNVLFIITLCILILVSLRPITRRVLWRLRNRLLVTYVLFGVVPIILIFVMLYLASWVLFGQLAVNMVRADFDRRLDATYAAARDRELRQQMPQLRIEQAPAWMKPEFKGILRDGSNLMMAAYTKDVFASLPIDSALMHDLPADLGTVSFLGANFRSQRGGVKVTTDGKQNRDAEPVEISSTARVLPPAKGVWDREFGWLSIVKVYNLADGNEQDLLMTVGSRPSLVVPRLFVNIEAGARVIGVVLLVIAGFFLFVEVISLLISLRLTRTITRTVHDLYLGTKQIASGDFSKRIPIRKTQDQLTELATSFNSMTERIQQLILEVKEKEKLESELEIAREVQAQLFPKGAPKLKTLELAGVCKPARVVSGDYYDFVTLGFERTAIVIGDISGKGISAALLMASVQSALHAQLSATDSIPSTATLVTRLNRQLYANTSPEKYATFYCAVYDDHSGSLAYTNAGHLRPILVRNGNATRLEVNGMVVGMFPDALYEQLILELQPGDLLAAFTDGITESENSTGEQFGEDRLARLLVENSGKPLDEIVEITTSSVREWAFDLDNQDDTTMLLARRI